MTEPQAVLWYVRYGSHDFELADNEQEAAQFAFYMLENADGAPTGVQFADGRLIPFDEWTAYTEEERRLEAVAAARREQAQSQRRAVRYILDPFHGQQVTADLDDPEWLGRPVGSS